MSLEPRSLRLWGFLVRVGNRRPGRCWRVGDSGTASGEVTGSAIASLHLVEEKTEAQGENPKSLIRPVVEQGKSPGPLAAHRGLSHGPTLPSVGAGPWAIVEEDTKHERSQMVAPQFLALTPGESISCPPMANTNS